MLRSDLSCPSSESKHTYRKKVNKFQAWRVLEISSRVRGRVSRPDLGGIERDKQSQAYYTFSLRSISQIGVPAALMVFSLFHDRSKLIY